jgi:hypothetical protein
MINSIELHITKQRCIISGRLISINKIDYSNIRKLRSPFLLIYTYSFIQDYLDACKNIT